MRFASRFCASERMAGAGDGTSGSESDVKSVTNLSSAHASIRFNGGR
jgi:hypothetical protein